MYGTVTSTVIKKRQFTGHTLQYCRQSVEPVRKLKSHRVTSYSPLSMTLTFSDTVCLDCHKRPNTPRTRQLHWKWVLRTELKNEIKVKSAPFFMSVANKLEGRLPQDVRKASAMSLSRLFPSIFVVYWK